MTVSTRIRRLAVVALVLLTTAMVAGLHVTQQAHAHDANSYIARWPTTDIPFGDVAFQAAPSVSALTSSQESAIYFGAVPWNSLQTSLTMVRTSDLTSEPDPLAPCAPGGPNSLHWQTVDGVGGWLAVTYVCRVESWPGLGDPIYKMIRAAIVYDKAEPWHFGTGTPPSNQFDMRGVSAHEFGHFAGWRLHLSGGTLCSSPNHTMCPSVPSGTPSYDQRTLETHDKHTFIAAYP